MPYKDIATKKLRDKERIDQRRKAYFDKHPCTNCGATENLELDHINPALKVSHRIWTWGNARREQELKKCQSLCHDCHWKKTRLQMKYGLVHGTVQGRRYYGCNCNACRKAVAAAKYEYRHRTGKR